jgi:hypothetical protein
VIRSTARSRARATLSGLFAEMLTCRGTWSPHGVATGLLPRPARITVAPDCAEMWDRFWSPGRYTGGGRGWGEGGEGFRVGFSIAGNTRRGWGWGEGGVRIGARGSEMLTCRGTWLPHGVATGLLPRPARITVAPDCAEMWLRFWSPGRCQGGGYEFSMGFRIAAATF